MKTFRMSPSPLSNGSDGGGGGTVTDSVNLEIVRDNSDVNESDARTATTTAAERHASVGETVANSSIPTASASDRPPESSSSSIMGYQDEQSLSSASTSPNSPHSSHNWRHLIALGICAVVQLFSIILFALFVNGEEALQSAWFGANFTILFAKRKLWIYPSSGGENMWYMVQVFAFMWIFYGLSTVFRRGPSGSFLYLYPGVIPTETYVFWTCSIICFDFFPFLAFRYSGIYLLPFVTGSACFSYLSIYNTALQVKLAKPILKRFSRVDLFFSGSIAVGGPANFACLCTYQVIAVTCKVFVIDFQLLSIPTGCTMALIVIILLMASSFTAETLFLDSYLREMNGHYVFLAIFLGFIYGNPRVPSDTFFHYFNFGMIFLSMFFFVVRIVVGETRKFVEKKKEEEKKKEIREKREEGGFENKMAIVDE